MKTSCRSLCAALFAAFATAPLFQHCVEAKDVFITIGGGYDPTGNQISIESNVLAFQKLLTDKRPDGPSHDVFFADGDSPGRDVQFRDADIDYPAAQRLMTLILGNVDDLGIRYRAHRVPALAGPSERDAIAQRLDQLSRELKAGDRLVIYVTGHGESAAGGSDDDGYDYRYDDETQQWVAKTNNDKSTEDAAEAHNTAFLLWDNDSVTTREFTRWLDRLSPDVTVVLVMVQCYSGGFSHAIFRNADPALGLSPARRGGFFAQVYERPAAGCTPEAQGADLGEYSKYFLAALAGATRDGRPIDSADYDGDGTVSFAEAHAYAIIDSDTIDIPVRTSDDLLRQYSRLSAAPAKDDDSGDQGKKSLGDFLGFSSKPSAPETNLLQASGPLSKLAGQARPDQRAVLEKLAKKLKLDDSATVEQVRQGVDVAKTALAAAAGLAKLAASKTDDALADLQNDVYETWPELIGGYTPTAADLTAQRADEFVEGVEKLASYDAYQAAKNRQDELTAKLETAQKVEAAWQRLLRTAETIVLAVNLEKTAPAEIVERYRTLIAIEEQGLALPAEK